MNAASPHATVVDFVMVKAPESYNDKERLEVLLCGRDVLVAERLLQAANIEARLEHMDRVG